MSSTSLNWARLARRLRGQVRIAELALRLDVGVDRAFLFHARAEGDSEGRGQARAFLNGGVGGGNLQIDVRGRGLAVDDAGDGDGRGAELDLTAMNVQQVDLQIVGQVVVQRDGVAEGGVAHLQTFKLNGPAGDDFARRVPYLGVAADLAFNSVERFGVEKLLRAGNRNLFQLDGSVEFRVDHVAVLYRTPP